MIPVHAFPVVNSKKDELVPSFIDIGKGLRVGESYAKVRENLRLSFLDHRY